MVCIASAEASKQREAEQQVERHAQRPPATRVTRVTCVTARRRRWTLERKRARTVLVGLDDARHPLTS
jgi:hypothetical protein